MEFTEQQTVLEEQAKNAKLLSVDVNEIERERDRLLERNHVLESSLSQVRTDNEKLRLENGNILADLRKSKADQASVTDQLTLAHQELEEKSLRQNHMTNEADLLRSEITTQRTRLQTAETQLAQMGNIQEQLQVRTQGHNDFNRMRIASGGNLNAETTNQSHVAE